MWEFKTIRRGSATGFLMLKISEWSCLRVGGGETKVWEN